LHIHCIYIYVTRNEHPGSN